MLSAVAVLMGTFLVVASANASSITLACKLDTPELHNTRFEEANQFVIDLEAQSVDMRAAETMDTSNPVNWLFVTRKDQFYDYAFSVRETGEGFVGGGVYGTASHMFNYEKLSGFMTWVLMTEGQPQLIRWKCFE